MNILFLLSSLEPAGSETYCVTLARMWQDRHRVFWISDRLHYGQSYTSLPIHQKAIPGGLWNTGRVARFIRQNHIELIHSHSRRAHWVAAQAAWLTGIPHVTTIHQPPPVHLFSKLWPCLGTATIAVDEAVEDHLNRHFSSSIKILKLIRNPIEVANFSERLPSPPPSPMGRGSKGEGQRRVLVIGRLTGGRWNSFQFFIKLLQRAGASLPECDFQVIGRIPEERKLEMEKILSETNAVLKNGRIEALGFLPKLPAALPSCTAVIAGGRSALESLAAGKPVIALGEKGVVGLCTADTLAEAMRSNFGDHLEGQADQFYPAKLELGLRQILNPEIDLAELGRWGRRQVEQHYNARTTAAAVDQLYQEVLS